MQQYFQRFMATLAGGILGGAIASIGYLYSFEAGFSKAQKNNYLEAMSLVVSSCAFGGAIASLWGPKMSHDEMIKRMLKTGYRSKFTPEARVEYDGQRQ